MTRVISVHPQGNMNVWMLFLVILQLCFMVHISPIWKEKKNAARSPLFYVAILSLIIFCITQGSDANNETNKRLSGT